MTEGGIRTNDKAGWNISSCITYRGETLLLYKEPLKKKKSQHFKEEKNRLYKGLEVLDKYHDQFSGILYDIQ